MPVIQIQKVRLVTTVPRPDSETILIDADSTLIEFQDKVLLENKRYEAIFGRAYKQSSYRPWKRKVVKITYRTEGGKAVTIRRLFFGASSYGVKSDQIGLTLLSLLELAMPLTPEASAAITLRPACKWLFYWNHPNHTVRVAFKLGLWSLLLSLILGIPPILSSLWK